MKLKLPWVMLGSLLVASCGGGGGDGAGSGATPAPPTTPPASPPSCSITITTPAGGAVVSDSGRFDCAAGSECRVLFEGETLNEVFQPEPLEGFRFRAWEDNALSLCQGDDSRCTVELDIAALTTGPCSPDGDGNRQAVLQPSFEDAPSEPPSEPPSGRVRAAGTIAILPESYLDADVNNPDNGTAVANNDIASAQPIISPATVGGYLNAPGQGEPGSGFERGDVDDFYRIEARQGQVATLYTADYNDADLELFLFDENGDTADISSGDGEIKQLTIPADGTWYLNATLVSGASSYLLTVGDRGAIQQRGTLIPGEVLVQYQAEGVLRSDTLAQRRNDISHRYGFDTVGGDVGRTFRLRALTSLDTSLGIQHSERLRMLSQRVAHKPHLRDRWLTERLVRAVRQEVGIADAAPNFSVQSRALPNDSFIDLLWHYELINVPAAWDITTGDPGVIMAVVDTGIIADHPDLAGQLLPGFDFISDPRAAGDGDGLDEDPTDVGQGSNAFRSGSFHGLHVAGTLGAAGNNGRGIAGIAYRSQIMPLRALDADGSGSTYDIMQAVRYAAGLSNDSGRVPENPAAVINLSIGGGEFSGIEQSLYETVTDLGIVIVAASGNDGIASVDFPGAYSRVFAVGATDAQATITDYSNTGSGLDLVAPGGRMEADANADGEPDGVLSTYFGDNSPQYAYLQGTSMATPHVSGVFALMLSANPDLEYRDFETLLQSGALTDDLGEAGRDNVYGWGLINARKAVAAALDAIGGTGTAPAQLGLSTSTLNFSTSLNQADVILSNLGDAPLQVNRASTSADWLTATPANTDSNGLGSWRIAIDRNQLADGSYQASVRFESSAGDRELFVSVRAGSAGIGNVGTVYILFIDAETQDVIAQAVTRKEFDYRYSLSDLPVGRYEVWAGTDTDNDGFICDEGETCGSYQTIDSPLIIDITDERGDLDFPSNYQITLPGISSAGANRKGSLQWATEQSLNNTTLARRRLNQ